uniref:Uncharacterized protein n=1 Tax=Chromera velia CCMP2878 TaxID=1169474 RepID=A0A0G4HRG1_9ALVE|eukprot:Cvel_30621.t1-p1 / transcript=Cvel_30621.t1 / gene=Cvel_30621 / organism=Chromera_velia_CCMP2878 / gene_product=hypothetical protein / transcript_product=hypothetical protein / location=Cvel_scaffold4397:4492-7691(-) / protein_length=278 / sequence_SO=supercontig / SO=protein_coding / is_pseudo=false
MHPRSDFKKNETLWSKGWTFALTDSSQDFAKFGRWVSHHTKLSVKNKDEAVSATTSLARTSGRSSRVRGKRESQKKEKATEKRVTVATKQRDKQSGGGGEGKEVQQQERGEKTDSREPSKQQRTNPAAQRQRGRWQNGEAGGFERQIPLSRVMKDFASAAAAARALKMQPDTFRRNYVFAKNKEQFLWEGEKCTAEAYDLVDEILAKCQRDPIWNCADHEAPESQATFARCAETSKAPSGWTWTIQTGVADAKRLVNKLREKVLSTPCQQQEEPPDLR